MIWTIGRCSMRVALVGAALLAGCAAERAPEAARRSPPNVLLYTIDTLRADRLGCYGYQRPTSPRLDAFAADATLFRHAVAQASWTKPAMASLFTGLGPLRHGAIGWKHKLRAESETLAELLRAAGYRTAAWVTNPHLVPAFGFNQGFDRFERRLKATADEITELVVRGIDELPAGAPFFVWAHTMEPHAPYDPSDPHRALLAPDADRMPRWSPRWKWPKQALPFLSDLYDGDVAENDAAFGRLIEALRARGLYDDLLLIVTADHGEEFREHGQWRHGNNLHVESLHVPLIVKLPGQREGRRVEETVQQIDLLPTVLELASVAPPAGVEGVSLIPLALARAGASKARESPVLSHLRLSGRPEHLSVVAGDWKLIRIQGPEPKTKLYRWRVDPTETRDLAAELPERVALLSALLDEAKRSAGPTPSAPEMAIDEELEREMRALGYLQ